MAPEETTGSQRRFEFRKRLLRAPAAFALVLSSSEASRSFVSWGIDLLKISYSLSLWYAAFPTYDIETKIQSSWIRWFCITLHTVFVHKGRFWSSAIWVLLFNKLQLLHRMNTMQLPFTIVMQALSSPVVISDKTHAKKNVMGEVHI
jgi:hypothetical protein